MIGRKLRISAAILWILVLLEHFPLSQTFQRSFKRYDCTSPHSSINSIFSRRQTRFGASIGGEQWDDFLKPHQGKVLGPSTLIQHHLSSQSAKQASSGSQVNSRDPWTSGGSPDPYEDPLEKKKQVERQMNIAKAYDYIRHHLPNLFLPSSSLDPSLFNDYIAISDNNQNRITLTKSVYLTLIKSLQMAASFSQIYPSLNLQSIHFMAELDSIVCRVQVVLPDSIRIEGQSIWEGMMYFGFDDRGLINSHIFDRNLPVMRPDPVPSRSTYPWLRMESLWNNLQPHPIPGTVLAVSLADRMSSMLGFETELSPAPPSLPSCSTEPPTGGQE